VDEGAAAAPGYVPPSTSALHGLLAALPALHATAWRLLALLARAGRGQLLPLARPLALLAGGHLQRLRLGGPAALAAAAPGVRAELYATTAQLLALLGLPAARQLAPDLLGAALVELYGGRAPGTAAGAAANGGGGGGGHRAASGAARAKRQRIEDVVSAAELVAAGGGAVAAAAAAADAAELGAQAAAVRALTALLHAGGAALPAEQRAQLDAAVAHIAMTAAAAGARAESDGEAAGCFAPALRALQVAAYDALLASTLSPCGHRPPFLGQAVELLRAGAGGGSADIAAACARGAAALEALLHPRATPMAGVRQYGGMAGLPALERPRLWSAVSPEPPAPAAPAAHADEGPAAMDTDARLNGGSAGGRAVAAATAGAGSRVPLPSGFDGARPATEAAATAAPPGRWAGAAGGGAAAESGAPLLSASGGAHAAATVAARPVAAAAASAPSRAPAAAPLADGGSSDSEGPMPEIDSGGESAGDE